MKKSELIKMLQEIPGDDDVYLYDWERDFIKKIEVAAVEYPHYMGYEVVREELLLEDGVVLGIDDWVDLSKHDEDLGSRYKCFNKYEYDIDGSIDLTEEYNLMYCRPVIFIGDYFEVSEINRTKNQYAMADSDYEDYLAEEKSRLESEKLEDDPEYAVYLRLKEKFSDV